MKIFKKMICLFSMLSVLSTTLFTGIANADFKEKSNNLNPVISVSGGMGINIEIEGASDETSIVITLEGAFIRFIDRIDVRDTIKIDVAILDFGAGAFLNPDDFILHISVGNDIYSYESKSFLFVFTFDFNPISN